MDTEQVFELLKLLLEYIKQSDKEEAIFASLDFLANEGSVEFKELQSLADESDETLISKCITKFMKEYGCDDEDDEVEEW